MKIKYSPCYCEPETVVQYIDEWTIEIDGIKYEFAPDCAEYPDVWDQSLGVIVEAHVENKELYLTVRYNYQDKSTWENPNYYADGGYRGTKYEDIG